MDSPYKPGPLGCTAVVIAYLAGVVLSGWVLVVLWGWFVLPVFRVAAPSIAQACGLGLFLRFMVQNYYSYDRSKTYTGQDVAVAVLMMVVYPLVVLGIGWFIYQFSGGG